MSGHVANTMKSESNLQEHPNAVGFASNAMGIQKLDVDCMEELFEWLSLRDLQALRQTCKRMKQVVKYYIPINYPMKFGRFEFLDDTFDDLCRFDTSFTKMYKSINFAYNPLTNYVIHGLKHILAHVEHVVISDAQLDGTLHDDFLRYCDHLKCLCIMDFSTIGIDSDWLLQRYPMLEQLIISDPEPFEENEKLQIFLDQNRNVKTLSITSNILETIEDSWIIESGVKLDRLDIEMLNNTENGVDAFCNRLNMLYDQGFYKRLQMHVYSFCDMNETRKLGELRGMEMIYIEHMISNTILYPFNYLRVFYLDNDIDIHDMDMLRDALPNIEIIHFIIADFENILPFFHRSPKLKEIKISSPTDGQYLNDGVIDLVALNNERKKCSGAAKLTIYVKEQIYLDTKFAKMRTKLSLIEIKRAESHVYEHEN